MLLRKDLIILQMYETSLYGWGGKGVDTSTFGNEWSLRPEEKELHISAVL